VQKLQKFTCKLNMHLLACRLPTQEERMGLAFGMHELFVEMAMQLAKAPNRKVTTTEYPEYMVMKSLVIGNLLDDFRRKYALEAYTHMVEVRRQVDDLDAGAAHSTEGFISKGHPPASAEDWESIKAALAVFLDVASNAPGWDPTEVAAKTLAEAVEAYKVRLFNAAVIHDVEKITTFEGSRERCRRSCYIRVRFEDGTWVGVVRRMVLLEAPAGAPPGTASLRIALCDLYRLSNDINDADTGDLMVAKLQGGAGDYAYHDYPVSLATIDYKMVVQFSCKAAMEGGAGAAYFVPCFLSSGMGSA
jgi:hypothetical protein